MTDVTNSAKQSLPPAKKDEGYDPVSTDDYSYPTLTLDDIYKKIGFGLYQIRLVGIVGLVALAEGAQIIVFTLVLTVLQNEWGYGEDVQSLVASCAFLGILLGCGSAGIIADRFGRKWTLLISNILMIIVNTVSMFSTNILFYGITRFLLGFVMGFYAPIGFTLCIESVPMDTRAAVVIFANCLIFVGELYACFVAWLTLGSLTDGNWKALTFYSVFPAVISLVLGVIYIDESVRYEMVMKDHDSAFQTMNKINRINGQRNMGDLTLEQQQALKEYERKLEKDQSDQEVASISSLFQGEYRATTLILWFDWFVNSFVYFGITIFMPYVLEKMQNLEVQGNAGSMAQSEEDLGSIALSVLVESSSVIIAALAIDTNAYGRKTVLGLFYGITAVMAFICFFMSTPGWYVVFATATKISLDVCTFYQYLYVIEVYPTKNRATGVGMAGGIGKTGAIVMPWVYILLMDDVSLNSPMMLNSMLCILALITVTLLPIETRGRELK